MVDLVLQSLGTHSLVCQCLSCLMLHKLVSAAAWGVALVCVVSATARWRFLSGKEKRRAVATGGCGVRGESSLKSLPRDMTSWDGQGAVGRVSVGARMHTFLRAEGPRQNASPSP